MNPCVATKEDVEGRQARVIFDYLLTKGIDYLRDKGIELDTFRPEFSFIVEEITGEDTIGIIPDNAESGASLRINSERRINGSKDLLGLIRKYSGKDAKGILNRLELEAVKYYLGVSKEDMDLAKSVYTRLSQKGVAMSEEGGLGRVVESITEYNKIVIRQEGDKPYLVFCNEEHAERSEREIKSPRDLLSLFKIHFKRGYRTKLYRFAEKIG